MWGVSRCATTSRAIDSTDRDLAVKCRGRKPGRAGRGKGAKHRHECQRGSVENPSRCHGAGALPKSVETSLVRRNDAADTSVRTTKRNYPGAQTTLYYSQRRSEEHTSELQSPCNLVCR